MSDGSGGEATSSVPGATAGSMSLGFFIPVFQRWVPGGPARKWRADDASAASEVRVDFLSAPSPSSDLFYYFTACRTDEYEQGYEKGMIACEHCMKMTERASPEKRLWPECCGPECYVRAVTVDPAARAFGKNGILQLCEGGCGEILESNGVAVLPRPRREAVLRQALGRPQGRLLHPTVYPEHWGLGEGGEAAAAGVLVKPDTYDLYPLLRRAPQAREPEGGGAAVGLEQPAGGGAGKDAEPGRLRGLSGAGGRDRVRHDSGRGPAGGRLGWGSFGTY
ncbi:hypothetical protein DFJ74DRAFT_691789 [Hyaloraphidium curvatum]|nr:hypothetical protein DFJ74DRAFT_691789 [Hyaloraphidium curvatum]